MVEIGSGRADSVVVAMAAAAVVVVVQAAVAVAGAVVMVSAATGGDERSRRVWLYQQVYERCRGCLTLSCLQVPDSVRKLGASPIASRVVVCDLLLAVRWVKAGCRCRSAPRPEMVATDTQGSQDVEVCAFDLSLIWTSTQRAHPHPKPAGKQ